MPGRRRTCSMSSSTWIEEASYSDFGVGERRSFMPLLFAFMGWRTLWQRGPGGGSGGVLMRATDGARSLSLKWPLLSVAQNTHAPQECGGVIGDDVDRHCLHYVTIGPFCREILV